MTSGGWGDCGWGDGFLHDRLGDARWGSEHETGEQQ